MKLYTIGFSGKSAETFFELLKNAGVKSIFDLRLSNRGQLAGFTKEDDLKYFLKRLLNIPYFHYPELAPDHELMDDYHKKRVDWEGFKIRFETIMESRGADEILKKIIPPAPQPICLLCSEAKANTCHRSLIAARVQKLMPGTEVIDL
ncbi:MAG: DUF488 domain-containing protein [Candidatus Cloacimonadaceae bacterium]|jgi:uncharacterized protein (DUF488 family)|nr:DUF488 domain-containing protein [Candidatus Cloacimonadota bacterium]MDX9949222.1 DUF488 domain-containing protein [Candidatus Syntrophosphaera sp.]